MINLNKQHAYDMILKLDTCGFVVCVKHSDLAKYKAVKKKKKKKKTARSLLSEF
mgnify:CR=1 FL=1